VGGIPRDTQRSIAPGRSGSRDCIATRVADFDHRRRELVIERYKTGEERRILLPANTTDL